jgi:hypothetical protein
MSEQHKLSMLGKRAKVRLHCIRDTVIVRQYRGRKVKRKVKEGFEFTGEHSFSTKGHTAVFTDRTLSAEYLKMPADYWWFPSNDFMWWVEVPVKVDVTLTVP